MPELSDFDRGLLVGLLIGEGSFGGDGKQPQVTLRMHVRHEAIFRWLVDRFPATRLYGPYHHGGRSYYQWMARGTALVQEILPVLEQVPVEELDAHAAERLRAMRERYGPMHRARARTVAAPNSVKMADTAELDGVRRLAARHGLPDPAAERLAVLLGLLADDPLAPTAIRDRPRVLDDHLADSLVALELPEIRGARTLADLGSGAGLPGLPLAIALPEATVALVESSARKCAFIERAAAACGLENVEVEHARVEAWPEGLGRFDVVTARALASLEVLVEYAAPLLVVGGTLVAWRGKRDPERRGCRGGRGSADRHGPGRGARGDAIRGRPQPSPAPHVEGYGNPRRLPSTSRDGAKAPAERTFGPTATLV